MIRRAKILAHRLSVYLFFILIPFVLWKVYTDNTEQKIRHLRNSLEDIERVQKYTSGKLELISHGLDKLNAKGIHTKQEISSIRNIKKSLTSISFPGKPLYFMICSNWPGMGIRTKIFALSDSLGRKIGGLSDILSEMSYFFFIF